MRTAVLSLAPGGIAAETITGGGIACPLRARAVPLAGVRADVRAPAVLAAAPLEVMLTDACASGGAHLLSCLPSLPSARHRVTLPSARHDCHFLSRGVYALTRQRTTFFRCLLQSGILPL